MDVVDNLERFQVALAGRYRIEREVGRGGMATVYLAEDLKHERNVAIKVLHSDRAAALGAERFLREIRLTAKLNHPHVLPLLDSGETDGVLPRRRRPGESGFSSRRSTAPRRGRRPNWTRRASGAASYKEELCAVIL